MLIWKSFLNTLTDELHFNYKIKLFDWIQQQQNIHRYAFIEKSYTTELVQFCDTNLKYTFHLHKNRNFEKEKIIAIHIFYHFIVEQYYQYYRYKYWDAV